MNRIRNTSFHYAAMRDIDFGAEDSILVQIFEKEKEGLGSLLRKKYHSNNVLMFYSVKDIDILMNQVYGKEKSLESQIPSFHSIFGHFCFLDKNSLRSGYYEEQLYEEIKECRNILVILSPNCIERLQVTDDWVRKEWSYAFKTETKVLIVAMEGVKFPGQADKNNHCMKTAIKNKKK